MATVLDPSASETTDGASTDAGRRQSFELSLAGRVLLAVLSGAAGVIHLAMVPSHWGSSVAEGFGFALVGWIQIAIAVMVLASPARWLVRVTLLVNVFAIGAWAVSRTWGLPFGEEAGHAHNAEFIDLVCVGIEVALVVGAATWLSRPELGRSWHGARLAVFAIVPIAVLALATAALASPSARNHAHDSHTHDDAAGAAAGHTHTGDSASSASAAGGHSHVATPASFDDKGLSLLSNGEMSHVYGPDEPLDAPTRAALAHQLALTRLIADTYPTLGAAKAAGSKAAGAFGPGLGIHMSMPLAGVPAPPGFDPKHVAGGSMSDGEILRPGSLMYAGTDENAPIAGFMYNAFVAGEPEGFAGPNDHWHSHGNLCIKFVEGGRITTIQTAEKTPGACAAAGGMFVKQTNYMVHVWTVPGYESNRGVFSDINPALSCSDGTYFVVPKQATDAYQVNKCRADAA